MKEESERKKLYGRLTNEKELGSLTTEQARYEGDNRYGIRVGKDNETAQILRIGGSRIAPGSWQPDFDNLDQRRRLMEMHSDDHPNNGFSEGVKVHSFNPRRASSVSPPRIRSPSRPQEFSEQE